MTDGASPTHRVPSLDDRLAVVKVDADRLMNEAAKLLAPGFSTGHIGFLMLAATKRSLALADGFEAMIRDRNFHAAAPMVRMQLDTALRISALGFVDDPHVYADAIMKGVSPRKLKDDTGKLMTDHQLQVRLSAKFPWISEIYKRASGFIHLSDSHLWTAIASKAVAPGPA